VPTAGAGARGGAGLDRAVVSAPVAVVGAAGQTGRRVVAALAALGASTRAVVRSSAGAATALAAGAGAVARGDLTDRDSLVAAFEGAAAVHVIPPLFHPDEDRLVATAVAAAERAGVDRFAYHSVLHAATPGVRHHERKARAEAVLRGSALDGTILEPGMYAQTLPLFFAEAFGCRREGDADVVSVPYDPAAPFTPIDLDDIAAATAVVLTEAGHAGATYELAGPERMSLRTGLELVALVRERPVSVRSVPAQAATVPEHWTRSAVADVSAMWVHYDAHGLVGNANVLRMLLGREPTTVEHAIRRELAAA
jgi:NAD(P)H dehydrogenase (quinone)